MNDCDIEFPEKIRGTISARFGLTAVVAGMIFWSGATKAADASTAFTGEKTAWHGFNRYDFLMDEGSLAIEPATAGPAVSGRRRCIVVAPERPAPGNPWSWRGCYWDHQPQTEIELLRRGFHIAYITADFNLKPSKHWDAWYAFLTEQHGLSKKPAFIGMSRGGEYAFTWATTHPDKVSCIYADNPGANPEVFAGLGDLARNDVPLLLICGSIDPVLGKNALAIEGIYQQFGGRISMMIKDGFGHHPHSLIDPQPIADFISQSVQAVSVQAPAFAGARFTKTSYYGTASSFRNYAKENAFIACRGPLFTGCYDRYVFDLPGVEGPISVIAPKTAAPGKPWIFRADPVSREATVDQALLAEGFHIVTGPVPFNSDGPIRAHWDAVYRHLIEDGFSGRPVMEGAGGAAGEAYAWAIDNPDKVSCIYVENPLLYSHMSRTQPLDDLAPLAKAGVPILHVCGGLDPWLDSNTRVAEKRYKELGGKITVIAKEGEGHFPTSPRDPQPVVEFITASVRLKEQLEGAPVLRTEPVGEPSGGERRMAAAHPDELKVAKVRRISHPGYAAGQCTFGIRDPWNRDRSRLMYNEGGKFTGKQPYYYWSSVVWGFVSELKHWRTVEEYERARKHVNEDRHFGFSANLWWSIFPGEENILYAAHLASKNVVRFDVDAEQMTDVCSYDPGDGRDLGHVRVMGWTTDSKLIVTLGDDNGDVIPEKGGWEIDVKTKERTYVPVARDDFSRWPAIGSHGHGTFSPDRSVYFRCGANELRALPTQQLIRTFATWKRDPPFSLEHLSWRASSNWFTSESGGPGWNRIAAKTGKWPTVPLLDKITIYQIWTDGEIKPLLTTVTACAWSGSDGAQHWNYEGEPIPDHSRDGRQLIFPSYDGVYSADDHQTCGSAPWGYCGLFLADLVPAAGNDDTTAPSKPERLTAAFDASSRSIRLAWARCTDTVGVDAYNVYRDGEKIATTGFIEYTDTIEGPLSASYRYGIGAVDMAGNEARSNEITVRAAP